MPLADGDVEGDVGAVGARGQVDGGGHFALVVVEDFAQMAAQADHRFRRFQMPMDGQRRARFQRVEHPLRLIVRPVAQVKIHPQPRRSLRLGGEIVEELLGNEHIIVLLSGRIGFRRQPEIRKARCPWF